MAASTKAHLAGSLLARLPAGAEVWLDPGTAAVHLDGEETHLRLPPPAGMRYVTPASGVCYALDTGEHRHAFGMARLGVYTVAEYPGQTFWMGAHGEFGVTYAHVIGLEKLVRGRLPDRLSLEDAYQLLEPSLRQALVDAITEINGSPQWEYAKVRSQIGDLSYACWDHFFRVFFDHGLLLLSRQFRIEGLARPMLM